MYGLSHILYTKIRTANQIGSEINDGSESGTSKNACNGAECRHDKQWKTKGKYKRSIKYLFKSVINLNMWVYLSIYI